MISVLGYAAWQHQLRREGPTVQAREEAAISLSTEQGFPHWLVVGTFLRGWALAAQGQAEEGIAQLQQGLAAWRAIGTKLGLPAILLLLAEAYGKAGQVEVGLQTLAEALALVDQTQERVYEAELYRLQGELLLARSAEHHAEAETCFRHALDVARRQQAKSLELLAPIYGWFTEGFDTKDLQEAKALLEALQ